MKIKLVILSFLLLVVLSSCSTDINFKTLVNKSEHFELKKEFYLNSAKYSEIINKDSKKWKQFTSWLNKNSKKWVKTSVSYSPEISIHQNNFSLLFLSKNKEESIVINFFDEKGKERQYKKNIKKGELDFLIGHLKKINKISRYGELFDKKRNSKKSIKIINIDDFETYINLQKEIQNTVCNGNIPQIELWEENSMLSFTPYNYCISDYGCVRLRQKNIIEVEDNYIFKNGNSYNLDSLQFLMKNIYLKENISVYNAIPEKVYFTVVYKNDEKLDKFKKLLKTITKNYDSLKIKNTLKIRLDALIPWNKKV